MNKIEEVKPSNLSAVIAKTKNNRLIACTHENGKFYKIFGYKDGLIGRYGEPEEIIEWAYEIQIPEPVITDDIFLELFCQKETLIQDNVAYSKFIDAWNSLNIDDRILLVPSITKMLKERQI